jgi:low temperature requirement protein LtrA
MTEFVRSPIRIRMEARAIDEPHRVSSQLELLFDLTFVVAVASVTAQLAHRIAGGHGIDGVMPFLQVFFAIWWAWMNFTWFASSYATDDVLYRLLTLVQMAGVLVLAAGVPAAMNETDYLAITIGYFVMRIGLVALWVRAGIEDPVGRVTAWRYAIGISVLQVGWVLRLVLQQHGVLPTTSLFPIFLVLVLLELSVPLWAERARPTSWHPHHIAERYGLFTIILLGEGVLAASTGVAGALDVGGVSAPFIAIAIASLVLIFSLWWLYFLAPIGAALARRRDRSYLWGYGHYGIFAALAALAAGLEVAVEHTGGHVDVPPVAVSYAVAIPVSVFLALVWGVNELVVGHVEIRPALSLGSATLILVLPLAAYFTGTAIVVAAIATVCAGIVAFTCIEPST